MRGIYKITNVVDGKCYIGKSENLGKRLKDHITSMRNGTNRNKHLQNAFNKFGKGSFEIEILESFDDTVDIDERERYYIALYKSSERKYGYNMTKGGDGGNSYVDCMTKEEKKIHFLKMQQLSSGKNNAVFGKHLYHNGLQQKYLSDDEIVEYERNGWEKGSNDFFRHEAKKRNIGERNPFYGKKHSQETIDKMAKTNQENGFSLIGTRKYHKNGLTAMVFPQDFEKYEADGWIRGLDPLTKAKISKTKIENPTKRIWSEEQKREQSVHFVFQDKDIYGIQNIISYLRNNGYPNIGRKSIDRICKGTSKQYSELIGKLIRL